MTRFWMIVQVSRESWAQRRDSFGKQEGSIWLVSSVYRSELDASRGATKLLEQMYPSCEHLFEEVTYALSLTEAMS